MCFGMGTRALWCKMACRHSVPLSFCPKPEQTSSRLGSVSSSMCGIMCVTTFTPGCSHGEDFDASEPTASTMPAPSEPGTTSGVAGRGMALDGLPFRCLGSVIEFRVVGSFEVYRNLEPRYVKSSTYPADRELPVIQRCRMDVDQNLTRSTLTCCDSRIRLVMERRDALLGRVQDPPSMVLKCAIHGVPRVTDDKKGVLVGEGDKTTPMRSRIKESFRIHPGTWVAGSVGPSMLREQHELLSRRPGPRQTVYLSSPPSHPL
jgi:hypothetical protein